MKLRPQPSERLPVSKAEWAKLREESRQSLPEQLRGKSLPEVLLSYQQRLLATTAAYQVTVVEKSRRTGYTWAVAADAVLHSSASKPAGGMDCFYIGYNLEMAREFIDTCAMWAKAFAPAASSVEEFLFKDGDTEKAADRSIQAFRITFASGFEIVALSSRPRSLRGRQGYVIIDEAAFHDDLPGLLKAALALLMWGGKVLVISTHDGAENPFNQLIEEIRKGRKPYALISLDFDQALQEGLFQRICLVTGKQWSADKEAEWRDSIVAFYGDDADEELYVIPAQGGGAYLPAHLLDRASVEGIPVLRWQMPNDFTLASDSTREFETNRFIDEHIKPALLDAIKANPPARSALGMDVARKGDLSVILPGLVLMNRKLRPALILEMRNIPFDCQRRVLYWLIENLPRLGKAAIDGTGLGYQLAEEAQQKFGETVERVNFSTEFYKANMPKFRAGFEDDLIQIPRDEPIYRDHRAIRVVNGVPSIIREAARKGKGEDSKGGEAAKGQRHGDGAVANFLAHYASSQEPILIDFQSGAPRESYSGFAADGLDLTGWQ
ncbi:hypothetical protein [Ferrovibrio sp.]|uniref:hypothetical protein n=1 Tax=Ferrovibrio sp. TaxID=1917215 RepID=UPI0035B3F8C5